MRPAVTAAAERNGDSRVRRSTISVRQVVSRFALRYRVWLLAFGHAVIFAAAFWLAFALRFDFQIPPHMVLRLTASLPLIVTIKLIIFYLLKHYHGWWRYVTFADLMALARATVFALLTFVLLNHYVLDNLIPRTVVVLDGIITAVLIGTLRSSWRLYREGLWITLDKKDRKVTLMVGADHNSGVVAHQIQTHPEIPYRIVGFLDRTADRQGARLGGIPIVGAVDEVAAVAHNYNATDVLVMGATLAGSKLRKLMDECEEHSLKLKIIPSVADHLNGDSPIPIRNVNINDLLRREPVQLDMESISDQLANRTVMVTGAGGSIGSEICCQLLRFRPQKLVLVDQAENSLFLANNELRSTSTPVRIEPCVANVLDGDRMQSLFVKHRPDFVFHAAAHKHVGLMEENVVECVRNNVFGTKCVADLADQFAAAKFVLISTDKAVHPASVMGASKQIAERYIHAMAQESSTAFLVVRFGNVLGSNGSVVPIFQEQIRRGGPITVTDQRMMRFFMTIPEASQLVLQASAMGRGGEIFVLEMGEQVRILDLAQDLVRLSGLPHDAIEITFVGARPGEKLNEELYFAEEETLTTAHPKVRAAYHRPYSVAEVLAAIRDLERTLPHGDAAVRRKLKETVPEYAPPPALLERSPQGTQLLAAEQGPPTEGKPDGQTKNWADDILGNAS